MPTIGELLTYAKQRLTATSDSASLDAQILLCDVLNVSRSFVLAHDDYPLSHTQAQDYYAIIQRRAGGEPVAYIRGFAPFYDRDFFVSPSVLIPRPETELLLEKALEIAKSTQPKIVVDIGTGSGALPVTFKAHYPDATVYALDISPEALAIAQKNAQRHATDIQFLQGNLLEPLIQNNIKPDLIMANLPYIAHDEMLTLPVSRYEPHLALNGGADGLDLIRQLLDQAKHACSSRASLLLEHGASQGQSVLNLAQTKGTATLYQDYAQLDRFVVVTLSE